MKSTYSGSEKKLQKPAPNNFSNKIKLNNVILIKNPANSSPFWQLGRVIVLFPGDYNKIRSV